MVDTITHILKERQLNKKNIIFHNLGKNDA